MFCCYPSFLTGQSISVCLYAFWNLSTFHFILTWIEWKMAVVVSSVPFVLLLLLLELLLFALWPKNVVKFCILVGTQQRSSILRIEGSSDIVVNNNNWIKVCVNVQVNIQSRAFIHTQTHTHKHIHISTRSVHVLRLFKNFKWLKSC